MAVSAGRILTVFVAAFLAFGGALNVCVAEPESESEVAPASLPWVGSPKPESAEAYCERLTGMLEEIKRREGRDNAQLYYIRDYVRPRSAPLSDKEGEAIKQVLKSGWNPSFSDLELCLNRLPPVYEQIRKAFKIDYSRGFDLRSMGPETPVPNFQRMIINVRCICAEGRRLEYYGKYPAALEHYQTALKYSHDFSGPHCTLISHLMSIAGNMDAARQMSQLLASGKLDAKAVRQTLEFLEKMELTQGTPSDAFREELVAREWLFAAMKSEPEKAVDALAECMMDREGGDRVSEQDRRKAARAIIPNAKGLEKASYALFNYPAPSAS